MKTVLILSGPTHEYFDPVRFIGNASSGKMGKALAEEALKRGLNVEFISGPVPKENLPKKIDEASSLIPPERKMRLDSPECRRPPSSTLDATRTSRLHLTKITSAEEMLAAAKEKFTGADIIIFAAAVADFQPAEKFAEKLSKNETGLALQLKPTPDIAAELCAGKRADQVAIGFALQTHDGENKAREKLISKNLNGIVLNTPATLGAEDGLFTWIDSEKTEPWGMLNKPDCAGRIFDKVL